MLKDSAELRAGLLNQTPKPELIIHDFTYKQFGNEPKIPFSTLTLLILCPVLLGFHLQVCRLTHIPAIQYCFMTILISFLLNYTAIIRRYQLMPYLQEPVYDNKLKIVCGVALGATLISIFFGWNGSGGIIFAMIWQKLAGKRIGSDLYFFAIIILGCLIMEETYSLWKLIEFVPGILYGYAASFVFTIGQASPYTITHQFVFLCSIIIPAFFPTVELIVPNLWQWLAMLLTGLSMMVTLLLTVKLMQNESVSNVMAIMSGILMVTTSDYGSFMDFIGCIIILGGTVLLIKKRNLLSNM